MISYPLTDLSQPQLSQSQAATSFSSVIPPTSFSVLHTDRHFINTKSKETMKKHKKSFRTAKFLFPVQMNMAARYQCPPIMPQISCNNKVNPYDSSSMSLPSYPPLKRTKFVRQEDSNIPFDNIKFKQEQKVEKCVEFHRPIEKENERPLSSANPMKDISKSSDIDSTFNFDLFSSPSQNEIYKVDISSACFDIVKRGNFPSIMVKNGYVEII